MLSIVFGGGSKAAVIEPLIGTVAPLTFDLSAKFKLTRMPVAVGKSLVAIVQLVTLLRPTVLIAPRVFPVPSKNQYVSPVAGLQKARTLAEFEIKQPGTVVVVVGGGVVVEVVGTATVVEVVDVVEVDEVVEVEGVVVVGVLVVVVVVLDVVVVSGTLPVVAGDEVPSPVRRALVRTGP